MKGLHGQILFVIRQSFSKYFCFTRVVLALLAGMILSACSGGVLGGGDDGGDPTPTGSSIVYYVPPAGSSSGILPLAMINTEEGDEILALGTFNDSGQIGVIRGLSVRRSGSDTTGYFLKNQDNSIAYYYQIDGSGEKLPRLIKADASNPGQDLSVRLYDYDWETGASSLITSFFVSESSGAYRSIAAYGSRDLDGIESSLHDAFHTFIEHRTHFVVDKVLSVRDYIFARFFDEKTQAFATGLEGDLTQADETSDLIETGEDFTTSHEATESESTAKIESIEGFDSSSAGTAFLYNVQGGIKIISGDEQKGVRNNALDQKVQVVVVDESLVPLAGVEVEFIYEEVSSTVTTDSDGYARFTWVLGADIGLQLLTARIKEIAPLGYAKNQITVIAEALEEYDFLRMELNGVAGTTPTSISGLWGLSFPFGLSGAYQTRGEIDYLRLTTDYLNFGSERVDHLHLRFPAAGEGTYTIPIGTVFDYTEIDISPMRVEDWFSLIGVPQDRYRTFGIKGHFTITIHQDSAKYWGEFSGVLEQKFVSQSSNGDPATISVTNGTFMYFK
ncbi:MAG: hypothetical protein A3J97_16510 [Spirochaetes bacterium RIFOXYC1_FULL_54_7]|nr:MAG: hypothetical protein A3J97_16510 [Spirochaetes bacterium RIFOXYC1_FULL_54_7]